MKKSDARSHKSQFEVFSKQEFGQKIRENIGDSRHQDTIDSFIQRSKKIMMQCFHGREKHAKTRHILVSHSLKEKNWSKYS